MDTREEQYRTLQRNDQPYASSKRRRRRDPREVAEHRAAALRAIRLYATARDVSLAKAREAYNAGKKAEVPVEVADETRDAVPRVTTTTFKRWSRKFKAKKLSGLQPPAGNRAGSGVMDVDADLIEFTIAMLKHNHLLSAKLIWNTMRRHFTESGKRLPSCGAFRRWLRRWKLQHREHFERISNPDAHRSKFMVSFGRKYDDVVRPLQLLEIDGSPSNIYCTDGRYYMTVAIDAFSRRIFAIISKTATAAAALLCYRKVILTAAVPEVVVHDHGQEYMGVRFQGGLNHCGSVSDPKPPHRPDLKPGIERANRTIADCFMPALPGFIGRNVAERSAIEAQKSFAKRLGEDRNVRFEVKLTASQLQKTLDVWIEEVYSNTAHDGLGGKTPNQVWREAVASGWIARRLPERELDVLLSDAGLRRVSKKGIRIDGADFWADELVPFISSSIRVALTDDLGAILVFTATGQFLCVARNPERSEIPRREMAIAARAGQRAFLRAARKRDRAAARKYPRELLQAVLSNRDAGAPPLSAVEPHDVPMLRAAADAIAAGESGRTAGPPVQTVASSDRQWKQYQRIKNKPRETWTEEEALQARVYEASPAYQVRQSFGAVA